MALTKGPRSPRTRKNKPATPTPPPAEPTPDRGATLNLQDPDAYIAWLASNADGFQRNGEQLREQARELWTAAADHDRQAQALDAQIKELEAKRDAERQQQKMRAAEAKQLDDRAKNSENAAADIQASIPVIQQAVANGNGQSPTDPAIDLDPKETARIDGVISRIDALRAELPADQRDEGEL